MDPRLLVKTLSSASLTPFKWRCLTAVPDARHVYHHTIFSGQLYIYAAPLRLSTGDSLLQQVSMWLGQALARSGRFAGCGGNGTKLTIQAVPTECDEVGLKQIEDGCCCRRRLDRNL